MPKGTPKQPWPLSREELQHEAIKQLATFLQTHEKRDADMGNPKNIDKFVKAYRFYRAQGFDPAEIPSHLNGIDFNQPVNIITMPPPSQLAQWQIPAIGSESPRVGCYWTIPRETTPGGLGIMRDGPQFDPAKGRASSRQMASRTEFTFECPDNTPPMPVLQSTAAPIIDTWTDRNNPQAIPGGSLQYFSAELGDHFKPSKTYSLGKAWTRAPAKTFADADTKKSSIEMDATASLKECLDDSQQALEIVQKGLNSINQAILRASISDNPSRLSQRVTTYTEAYEKAVEAANHAKSIIEQLGDDATPAQKLIASEALNCAHLARNDFKDITSRVEKIAEKGERTTLTREKILPPIARTQPSQPEEKVSGKEAQAKKHDRFGHPDIIPPIAGSKASSSKHEAPPGKRHGILEPLRDQGPGENAGLDPFRPKR